MHGHPQGGQVPPQNQGSTRCLLFPCSVRQRQEYCDTGERRAAGCQSLSPASCAREERATHTSFLSALFLVPLATAEGLGDKRSHIQHYGQGSNPLHLVPPWEPVVCPVSGDIPCRIPYLEPNTKYITQEATSAL